VKPSLPIPPDIFGLYPMKEYSTTMFKSMNPWGMPEGYPCPIGAKNNGSRDFMRLKRAILRVKPFEKRNDALNVILKR
jgi:hypothetical protein